MTVAIHRMIYDVRDQRIAVEMSDGNRLEDRMQPDIAEGFRYFQRLETDLVFGQLELTMDAGEQVTLELGWPGDEDLPASGRRIAYLDQCHWISLAKYRYARDQLSPEVAEACAELIRRVEDRSVILPLSSAHFAEAAPYGSRRRHLVLTMLALSRGWQMRSPLDIRRQELREGLARLKPLAEEIFTLAPGAVFGDPGECESPSDFPSEWRELHLRVTNASAMAAMLLENRSPSDRDQALALATSWAESHHELAIYMRDAEMNGDDSRLNAHARVLADLRSEIAIAAKDAGISDQDLAEWLRHSAGSDFSRMPFVGRLREVVFHRLRNAEDRWEPNDLVDMHYLTCAAGYADVVVGERKASHYLQRANQNVPEGGEIVSTLADALAHLG